MTSRFFAIGLILAFVSSSVALADFREGLAAFEAGDYASAAKSWRADAEAGEAASQRNLGLLYLNGLGVKQSPTQAARWFKLAAAQSFAPAAANLADMYLRGRGVKADRAKAAEYMRIAAEAGLAESQHNLAVFYEHGVGVEKDPDAAIFWYRRAAEQDFGKAVARLAVLRPEDDPATDEESESQVDGEGGSRPAQTIITGGLVDRLVTLFSPTE